MDNTSSSLNSNLSFYTSNYYKSEYHKIADQYLIDFDFDYERFSNYLLDNYDEFDSLFSYLPKELLLITIDKYLVNDFGLILDIISKNYTPYNIYKELEPIFYFSRYYYVNKTDQYDEKFVEFDYSYFEESSPEYSNIFDSITKFGMEKKNFEFIGMNYDTLDKCYKYLEPDEFKDIIDKSHQFCDDIMEFVKKINPSVDIEYDSDLYKKSICASSILMFISFVNKLDKNNKNIFKDHILKLFED